MNTKLNKRLTDRSINVCVARLKEKLLNKFDTEIFKARYGQGYYIDL